MRVFEKRVHLTDSEKVIRYCLENLKEEEISHLTIGKLKEITYSSNATIIRFCRKFGFNGFRQLKEELIKETQAKKYIRNAVDFTTPVSSDGNTAETIATMANLYKECVDLITSSLKPQDMQYMAEMIFHANRLFIYA